MLMQFEPEDIDKVGRMRSVPPRGSGWVPIAAFNPALRGTYVSLIRFQNPSRGGVGSSFVIDSITGENCLACIRSPFVGEMEN